jgi:putative nucleotidyltransferase with HDIG domain
MFPRKIDMIIQNVERLRPMPTSITRILRAMEEPMATAANIGEMIGLDQALAAMILQSANSVAMGFSSNCSSLMEAVMRLGFKRLKGIILSANAIGPFNRNLRGYRLGAGELWNHSITTAVASEYIARQIHYKDPETAYAAGLLHDIGKLFLDQYVLADYTQIVNVMRQYKLSLWQTEERLFGIDHAAVGSLMAQKWNFPGNLTDAIHYHHAPSLAATDPILPAIINIGNIFYNRPDTPEIFVQTIHPETPRILDLTPEILDRIQRETADFISNN